MEILNVNARTEKGNGPWSSSREHVLKKLKKSSSKPFGSRVAKSPMSLQGTANQELPSSPESASDSASDDDSDYTSESEDEAETEEPSPLPPSRPSDPSKAVEYDILKAVWAPRNRVLQGTAIRSSLGEYWNLIKSIRDKWKSEMTLLQQAELKKDSGKLAQLRPSVANHRHLLEKCIRLTLNKGHRDIIEKYVYFYLLQVSFPAPLSWTPKS